MQSSNDWQNSTMNVYVKKHATELKFLQKIQKSHILISAKKFSHTNHTKKRHSLCYSVKQQTTTD